MKHKTVSRIVVLSMLLALIFSAVGAKPANAAGIYTHTWFIEKAIEKLDPYRDFDDEYDDGDYDELVHILNQYPWEANYGSVFPDLTYGNVDKNWAEYMHDTTDAGDNFTKYLQFLNDKGYSKTASGGLQTDYYKDFLKDPAYTARVPNFRAALMQQLVERFKHNPRTVDDEKMIAFLFGLIAHQESDIPWHWNDSSWLGFEKWAEIQGLKSCGFVIPDLNAVEPCFDVVLLYYDNPDHVLSFSFLPTIKPVVFAASDSVGIPRPACNGRATEFLNLFWDVCNDQNTPLEDGQSQVELFWQAIQTNPFGDHPGWLNDVQTYVPGGIDHGSAFVAGAWMQTWDLLKNHTNTLYAKPVASGLENCTSWANACVLRYAMNNSIPGQEIWAAAGTDTHKPTGVIDRSATFQLKNGVAVYGGFAGTETSRDQRNPKDHPTILSGDIGTPGNNSDNSYHVVTGTTGATLDGFTISDGNANGTDPNNKGGGMYNNGSSPTVTNVTFSGNTASLDGGGMYNNASNPTVTNVTFSGNWALYGGGMYNNGNSIPTVTNVTFSDNTADDSGGGMLNNGSIPWVTNVTFSANNATRGNGGGMYNGSGSLSLIYNTIFWGNTATNGAQIYNDNSNLMINYSVVQGGYAGGTNIITDDPKLGTLGNYGGVTQTIPLLPGSSAIDTGTMDWELFGFPSTMNCPSTDQRGVLRPQDENCDIGAYEYNYAGTYYVKPTASGSGNCQSWANACTLQNALVTATSGDEIWVAAETYKPTTGTDRTATFQLKSGVAVYGGFDGTETTRDQRKPATNITILSGDIGTSGDNSDNSYHVVTANGITGATLDGFTISGGNANGTVAPQNKGGGMYNYGSSPTVTNVIFSGNAASLDGGGMYNDNASNPTVTNVTFSGNSALYGGGMYNNGNSNPTVSNVTFSDNTADDSGGGMFNNGSHPTVTNVTFSANKTTRGSGAGMYNLSGSNPTITNVTFANNNSAWDGGGIANKGSSPTIINSTFSGNKAVNGGGGIQNFDASATILMNVTFSGNQATGGGTARGSGGGLDNCSSPNVKVYNSIFWGNTAVIGNQINNIYSDGVVVDSSVVDGGYVGGTNIITADPLLGKLGNYGGFTTTIPLLVGSSAIDTGKDSVCPATDQRGVTRPQGAHCDIGAFEYVKMAPVATTNAASAITTTGATLNGIVNANNDSSTVSFEYGLSTSYGTTVTATQSPVTGITNTAVSKAIIGLTPNTTYHYRVVAVNSGGTTNGLDQTFKTLAMVQRAKNGGFNLYPIGKKIPTSWVAAQFATTDGKDTATKKEGAASVKIAGAAGKIKTLTQTLSLIGPLGDTFTFSYWVKADKFPAAGLCQAQVLFYSGTTLKGTKTLKCPTGTTYAWKQAKLSFTAPAAYTKVVIKFTFSKASGTVWFDLVSLMR
jgi:hypothetical protein